MRRPADRSAPRHPAAKDALGREGEEAAARHLESLGLRILARRERTPWGEIDLVAADERVVAFCEVKARRSLRFGDPALAVDPRRQQRLRNAALHLLDARPDLAGLRARLDVIEVFFEAPGRPRIHHIEDAF